MVWALMDAVFTEEEMITSNYAGGKLKNTIGQQKKALDKEKLTAIAGNYYNNFKI